MGRACVLAPGAQHQAEAEPRQVRGTELQLQRLDSKPCTSGFCGVGWAASRLEEGYLFFLQSILVGEPSPKKGERRALLGDLDLLLVARPRVLTSKTQQQQ